MYAGSVAFRVCLYFATNPGKVLYTSELRDRFCVNRKSLLSQLKEARANKLIVGVKKQGDAQIYFMAGPALAELIEKECS